jgi:SAM-dependent methyltransferase
MKFTGQPDATGYSVQNSLERANSADRPLTEKNFVPLVRHGFGDPANAYAHSLAWFQGHVYAGLARHCYVASRPYNLDRSFQVFPVKLPEFNWDLDWRAQIWRFDPQNCLWENIYISPMCMGSRGFEVPRQIGFRDMEVFQGKSDLTPALYVTSWGSHMGLGPFILRCVDGVHFEEVGVDERKYFGTQTLRALVAFDGRLFTLPTGRDSGIDGSHVAQEAVVLESCDPYEGGWRPVSEPYFGDHKNVMLMDMETFNGCLYVGTMNPYDGYQVWKTEAKGKPPYRWKQVISQGAFRGKLNEIAVSFCTFKGSLYVGGAIYAGGYDRIYNVGPGAPELIRINPDDTWDLIVGEPRITPEGLKVPLSGLGPGFNNIFAGYIWRMCAHEGWLYAGTCVWSPWLPFANQANWPEKLKESFAHINLERLVEKFGGFDLWRSQDGDHWVPVTVSGFGNPYNCGLRSMVSTQHGLFISATNQFGPEVAVKRMAGWKYEPNSRGGVEIWLGTHNPPDREITVVPLNDTVVPSVWHNPAENAESTACEDLIREFYDDSGWRHVGFWREHIKNPREACENLLEELLAFTRPTAEQKIRPIPTDEEIEKRFRIRQPQEELRTGSARELVLVTGCRTGVLSSYLLNYFAPEELIGVVSTREEKRFCAARVPEVRFDTPGPFRFKFARNTFDKVICIECLSRNQNRRKAFREMLRVLKPGGQLLCSDLIFSKKLKNIIDVQDYKILLQEAGFAPVQVVDATHHCLESYREYISRFLDMKTLSSKVDENLKQLFLARLPGADERMRSYFLIWGAKNGDQK